MTGILFGDVVAGSITKLQALLDARPESYATGASVSNGVIAGRPKMVTIQYAGGPGDTDTIDTTFLAVNVYDADEGVCNDLTRMVRALFTARGVGSMCDGNPITHTSLNVGPTPIENATDAFQFRMVIQANNRGIDL